jgi:beta-lactamase class D
MKSPLRLLPIALFALLAPLAATTHARTLCTAIADATTGQFIVKQGRCDERVTPASTFKIAIALMGFDAGFLKNEHDPVLPFKEGYPAWVEGWKQPTDPQRWLKLSVFWFSQRVTESLGAERFARYAKDFGYGNADVSGDPGKHNGLERSWVASSLRISPREQVEFLRKLLSNRLPVSQHAIEMTRRSMETTELPEGWTVQGKTGAAYPKKADGSLDEAHGYGWYVGWATRGDRTVVFARLTQDDRKQTTPPGVRTRDALLPALPALIGSAAR